jgi:hypothetical protein
MNTTLNSNTNGNGRLNLAVEPKRDGHSGYRPGGITAHNKPTGTDSQHTIGDGEIPGFAYWLRSQELNLYRKLALATAATSGTLEEIRRRGADTFNGVWGIFERSYESQVEAAQPELARLRFEREAIQHELKNAPPTVAVEPTPSHAPKGKNGVGYWVLWVLVVLLCVSEGLYVASFTRFETQDWLVSIVCVMPFVLTSLAAKSGLNHLVGPQRTWALRILALLGAVAFIAWLACFGQNYARPVSLDGTDNLISLAPDRRLQLPAQMVLGFVVVLGLLAWIRSLELRPFTLELNRNWKLINDRAQELDQAIEVVVMRVGEIEGRLVEYRSCRENFIAVGVAEYQVAVERTRLFNDRLQQLNGSLN